MFLRIQSDMHMSNNFEEIEAGLKTLIADVQDTFSKKEVAMVSEYLEVGEYLLALETFVGVVVENGRSISMKTRDEAVRVGALMKTDSPYVLRIMDAGGT